ncbi:hypothetical protein CCR97_29170 [Rhodoplanes elegans]|uniref:Uncharacterized protein n=1 Tax=Rhodoplanes elegans TaxID=29408 RepID=A0A327K3R3_9BRAD|nr:hypothetical protein [Rhodoplanes elegans]MBK5962229.1 hypothetical protein [Rhodoplanes elegans]RAI32554.1 hypothetical protein CH338_23995 [Rhodoplanes elegans]
MGHQEDELLALAATLRHALAELAELPPNAMGSDSLVRIERLTLRWIESVESLLRTRGTGRQAEALRAALVELRSASARIRSTDVAAAMPDSPARFGSRSFEL